MKYIGKNIQKEEIIDCVKEVLNLVFDNMAYVETELFKLDNGDVFKAGDYTFTVLERTKNTTIVASNGLFWDEKVDGYSVIQFNDDFITSIKESSVLRFCNNIYKNILFPLFGNKLIQNKTHYTMGGKIKEEDFYVRPITKIEWDKYKKLFDNTRINNGFWLLDIDDIKSVNYVNEVREIKICRQKEKLGIIIVFELANDIQIKKRIYNEDDKLNMWDYDLCL